MHQHSHGSSEHEDGAGHSHKHDHGHDHAHEAEHAEDGTRDDKVDVLKQDTEEHSHSRSHAQENENMTAVFLHILADAMGSVAVIISAVFIRSFGVYIADPICCFLISILILASVVPLIKSAARTLTLGQSGKLSEKVQNIIEKEVFNGYRLRI